MDGYELIGLVKQLITLQLLQQHLDRDFHLPLEDAHSKGPRVTNTLICFWQEILVVPYI